MLYHDIIGGYDMASNIIDNEEIANILEIMKDTVVPVLREKDRRLVLGAFSLGLGYGGRALVSNITGMSRITLAKGEQELKAEQTYSSDAFKNSEENTDAFSDNLEANFDASDNQENSFSESDNDQDDKPTDVNDIQTLTPQELIDRILGHSSNRIPEKNRQRATGGGRKSAIDKDPELLALIEKIVSQNTYGNPESVVVHTNLSLRKIVAILEGEYGKKTNRNVVQYCLKGLGYSLQQNAKLKQVGKEHVDRNEQFEFINNTATQQIDIGNPVISIDCKKKENIGNFKNGGHEYQKEKHPRAVKDHDYIVPELGKVAPYGVYNLNDNAGFVNLGISHDTPEFSVASIRAWWYTVGQNSYKSASMIYITCDGGGSNSSRSRLFKMELASLVEEIGIPIQVSHFPPGTSKWNKVEHRLFAMISKNWAGKPLISVAAVMSLIGSTTTTTGLKVICKVDENHYATGRKIDDAEYEKIDIEYIEVGTSNNWNYIIRGFRNI